MVDGGRGNDRLIGNTGNDRIFGDDGDDYLEAAVAEVCYHAAWGEEPAAAQPRRTKNAYFYQPQCARIWFSSAKNV